MSLEAVNSLARILDQMLQHQHIIVEDREVAESLLVEVRSIQDILERSSRRSGEELEMLMSQIINSANKAKGVIESEVISQIPMRPRTEINITITISSLSLEQVQATIYSIKQWAVKIEEQSQVQDLQPRSSSSVAGHSTSEISEVSLDDDFVQIVNRLVKGSKQLQIVSVVGMGGIGKTTLAKKVYNDSIILSHFDIHAWATVSQSYNLQQTLLNLLDSTKNLSEISDIQKIKEYLYKYLKGNRYLIVLDDVWDSKVFDDLKQIFPNDNNSSRIMLTTRLKKVAIEVNSCRPLHRMHLLSEEKSWKLFCYKVFGEEYYASQLKEIGKKIVRTCQGLPLAIIVLAGLLSKAPRTHQYWRLFAEKLSSEVIQNDETCSKMLLLSYNHLPSHLRECFLYAGIFPEDFDIPASGLVKLWVAADFIKSVESKSLEDVAFEYLLDLIDRSLLMVGKFSSLGEVKTCKIHDLVRDFCIKEAKNIMLFHITNRNLCGIPLGATHRLLSVHPDATNIFPCDEKKLSSLSVSSFVIFDPQVHISEQLQDPGLLRVLDTRGRLLIDNQGEENVFPFYNLRYLSCKYGLNVFPTTSSSMLQNLQTLILRNKSLLEVPIWNMPKLRHVIVDGLKLNDPLEGEGSIVILEHLQTLSKAQGFRCSKEVLKRIPNLKKLGVSYSADGDSLYFSLSNLVDLQKLEALSISLYIRSVPSTKLPVCMLKISLPLSLRKLSLRHCELAREDLQMIGYLPNLEVLKLKHCDFINSEWEPAEGEFLSLKYLMLHCLNLKHWNLKHYKADGIHFQSLQCLIISYCNQLIEIPSGIGHIPMLQLIELCDCANSLIDCVKEMQAEQRELGNEDLQVLIHKSMKKMVMLLDISGDRQGRKAMKVVVGISGIESVARDMEGKKLTLVGDFDPVRVVAKLRKLCHSEIISLGPAKEVMSI